MVCDECKKIGHSYDGDPFFHRDVDYSRDHPTYVCGCGQRWWCYNNFYRMWTTVDDDKTWETVLGGCQRPVMVGKPAISVDRLYELEEEQKQKLEGEVADETEGLESK
ncbi:hypothetical protein KY336_03870 [Candidatus Woesearchaeota archaeon]|nr:hypothetical protein [Candidatus Woesearchaeota archaeon]